jgi:hypothetical protein
VAHPRGMEDGKAAPKARDTAERLPDLRPSQMGWIFRDGGCVAIERQVDDAASGVPAD